MLLSILCLLTLPLAASEFTQLMQKGDVHDRKSETQLALKYYLPAEKLKPNDAELLVKIARQYALSMPDLKGRAAKQAAGESALAYARRAAKANSRLAEAHLAVAIALGKLAPYRSNRENIEASREIKSSAEKATQLDPKNDYAWHILGRWHQALANLGGTKRALAEAIYGKLPAASNEEAIKYFRKAIALKPKRLVHTIELGRTYAMMKRYDEAIPLLKRGLAMPNREKDDRETKARGKKTLDEIS